MHVFVERGCRNSERLVGVRRGVPILVHHARASDHPQSGHPSRRLFRDPDHQGLRDRPVRRRRVTACSVDKQEVHKTVWEQKKERFLSYYCNAKKQKYEKPNPSSHTAALEISSLLTSPTGRKRQISVTAIPLVQP